MNASTIERGINGLSKAERLDARRIESAPLVSDAPPIELSALRRAHDDRDEVLALLDVLKVLSTVLRPAGRLSPPESALSRRGRPR